MFPQCECHTTRNWNIFLIFRFFSKYPGHFWAFCYLARQNHDVSISEHAARKASGKGRARRSVSVNRGVERYNRLYFEPLLSLSSLTDPLECCGTDQGIEPLNANNNAPAHCFYTGAMVCFVLFNKRADLSNGPTFVVPSAGKEDFCGRNCGPCSHACPLTQLVCCARDPSCTDAEDAYDADADKAMFLRCAVFGTLCLPIFALIDVGMTVLSCFRPSSYSGCFRSLR